MVKIGSIRDDFFFISVIDVVVVFDPKILALKFGQNQVSNSWNIAAIEFVVSYVGGWCTKSFWVNSNLGLGYIKDSSNVQRVIKRVT